MAWDKTLPLGTQKIRLSDEEIRANWAALEVAIGTDHDFNTSTTTGKHKVIQLMKETSDPAAVADLILFYNKDNELFFRLPGGRIIPLDVELNTLSKTAAYTVLLLDHSKLILVTNTTTITLTAAATLGDGWFTYIKNNGTGTVTIDPNGAETIDGAATLALGSEDDVVLIVCDGSNFHTAALNLTKPTITFENSEHAHAASASGGLIDIRTNIPYIRLHDSKATGTDGGTFTSGAWQKRTITEDQDTGNNVAVASSVITLEAGTYDCLIRCPGSGVGLHQARLRNTTDGSSTLIGSNTRMSTSNVETTDSIIQGGFTIAAQKTFEIQHRCSFTLATTGFGFANSFGENEIYTVAEFWKVST